MPGLGQLCEAVGIGRGRLYPPGALRAGKPSLLPLHSIFFRLFSMRALMVYRISRIAHWGNPSRRRQARQR